MIPEQIFRIIRKKVQIGACINISHRWFAMRRNL
jgi:hypothetical protein